MKIKFILLLIIQFMYAVCFSQYIGVRARYTESRMVDHSPNLPGRENRLILSFFDVSPEGIYTPISLSNYDIWVYKLGLQYGSLTGGVLDSSGNNYPGYPWPAPMAVSYFNSYHANWIDCDPHAATHYIVNGHELDCGFITVSYWDIDFGSGAAIECFPAPNVCLPYYMWPNPFFIFPGNVNFTWPVPATPPLNWYSFSCYNSTQQVIIRGVLPHDSVLAILPVTFDNVKATALGTGSVKITWSNLTESDILHYIIERAVNGNSFQPVGQILPLFNNGNRGDYEYIDIDVPAGDQVLYRIRAVENSGQSLYSEVVRIHINSSASIPVLSVYPNPVINSHVTFQLNDLSRGRYAVVLVNDAGQETIIKEIQHPGGSLLQTIQLSNLRAGLYYFIIRSENNVFSKKIIIKN